MVGEGGGGGVESAHAVDSAARGGGGRAEIDVGRGGAVLAAGGAEEELAQGGGAADDVAADEVGIMRLERCRSGYVAREDAGAKAAGEAFDLGLEAVEHVLGGAVGNVAVGPSDVLAGGCAGGVEEGGLRQQDKGASGAATAGHVGFGGCDIVERAAKVDSAGAQAGGGVPGNGAREGVVDFECGGAVLVAAKLAAVGAGESMLLGFGLAGEGEELPRRDVAEDEVGWGQIAEVCDAGVGGDAAAEVLEVAGEGVSERLRAATGDGPAVGVGGCSQHKAEGVAEGLVERHEGVRGYAGEQGACRLGAEAAAGEGSGGLHGAEAEAREQEWMPRKGEHGAEHVGGEIVPTAGERLHEATPGPAVLTEGGFGCGEVAGEGGGGAVVERVGEGVR